MTLFQVLLLATSLGWNVAAEANNPYDECDEGAPDAVPPYNTDHEHVWPTAFSSSSTFKHNNDADNATTYPPRTYGTLPPAPIVRTEISGESLLVPTRTVWPTFKSPRVESTRTGLDIPVASSSNSEWSTYSYNSPRIESTKTELDIPAASTGGGTMYYPSSTIASTGTGLEVPAAKPEGSQQSQVLPEATTKPQSGGHVTTTIITIVHSATGGSYYILDGETIVPGYTGAVIEGTTYSAPHFGDVVYVNGVETPATAVPELTRLDGQATVITTTIAGGYAAETTESPEILATLSRTSSGEGVTTSTPAQQTGAARGRALPAMCLGAILVAFPML